MDILTDLLKNQMFYTALLALLNALRAWLLPNMPSEVVIAINGLLVVIFGVLAFRYGQQQAQVRAANVANVTAPK